MMLGLDQTSLSAKTEHIQNVIKDWQQNGKHLNSIQINRFCHSLAVPFDKGFEVVELIPKLSSHSIFMCLLKVWNIGFFSPYLCKWVFTLSSLKHSSDYQRLEKEGFSPAMKFPLVSCLSPPHLLPQVQVPYKLCCNATIIHQSSANQACHIHY